MPPTPEADRSPSDRIVAAERWFDGRTLFDTPVRVLITGDRITRVGGPEMEAATEVVVLDERAILCPGFVDTHSHSDFSIPDDPHAIGAIMQGITTQVVGQCGFSAAPVASNGAQGPLSHAGADDPTAMPTAQPPTWQSFGDYREQLHALRPAINVLPFVGQNTLVRALNSADPDRVADLAGQSVAEGARGISTGLSYQLGRQTTDADVAQLASVASRHGVPYHTHMRYSTDETLETLQSTLILLEGQCGTATISHVFPRLRDRTSTVDSLVSAIERSASEFDSLTFDMTVYEHGGTPWTQGLPKWAIGSSFATLTELTADPGWRRRVIDHLANDADGWVVDWERLVISKVNLPDNSAALGRTVAELAGDAGMSPAQYAIELLVRDGHFWVSPPNKRWSDVLQLLQSERCIPMVDGMTVDPRRPDCIVALDRSWNAFRRFLTKVVPGAPMSLEIGLRKLTSDAATRLGLPNRGVITEGAFADLTVLNPDELQELTPPAYELHSTGIEGVMVNGQWVLDPEQNLTSACPGVVL